MSDDLLAVSKLVRLGIARDLAHAMAREQQLLRSAVENHSSMPEHYWQERHMLMRKVEAINAVIEVLEEERHG